MLFYDRSCNYASGTYRKSRVERLSTDEAQLSTTNSDGMWSMHRRPRADTAFVAGSSGFHSGFSLLTRARVEAPLGHALGARGVERAKRWVEGPVNGPLGLVRT